MKLVIKNVDEVIENAKARGVNHFISICTTVGRFEAMKNLTAHRPEVSLSCGVHPLNVEEEPFDYDKLLRFCSRSRVVAVGETGLDYHYALESKPLQIASFEQQIEIANKVNKPLIIHTRSARQDTMDMLIQGGAEKCGGVLHCFTEDYEMANAPLILAFISPFQVFITFKNA